MKLPFGVFRHFDAVGVEFERQGGIVGGECIAFHFQVVIQIRRRDKAVNLLERGLRRLPDQVFRRIEQGDGDAGEELRRAVHRDPDVDLPVNCVEKT